jgi:hypothetical protein
MGTAYVHGKLALDGPGGSSFLGLGRSLGELMGCRPTEVTCTPLSYRLKIFAPRPRDPKCRLIECVHEVIVCSSVVGISMAIFLERGDGDGFRHITPVLYSYKSLLCFYLEWRNRCDVVQQR